MDVDKNLLGKVALVTGGASGIGRAISLELSARGAAVVVADLIEDHAGQSTTQVIESRGGVSAFRRLDISDFDAVSECVKDVDHEYGGLGILVNNAGITSDQLAGRMKPEQFQRVIEVNLGGCFNCCRAASRVMLRRKEGRIINISSIVASIGRMGQVNYAASKAGIEGLTRSLALELAHRGITANAIAPGFINTSMTESLECEMRKQMIDAVPLGRPGEPQDIADLAAFLAGPGASYITGQVIHVNGGLYLG